MDRWVLAVARCCSRRWHLRGLQRAQPLRTRDAFLQGGRDTREEQPGTDHCHQMLLLPLLQRILRQREEGNDLPFSDIQGSLFFFFSELSNVICLCTFLCGMRLLERSQR